MCAWLVYAKCALGIFIAKCAHFIAKLVQVHRQMCALVVGLWLFKNPCSGLTGACEDLSSRRFIA
jgi:hypothetical protein